MVKRASLMRWSSWEDPSVVPPNFSTTVFLLLCRSGIRDKVLGLIASLFIFTECFLYIGRLDAPMSLLLEDEAGVES